MDIRNLDLSVTRTNEIFLGSKYFMKQKATHQCELGTFPLRVHFWSEYKSA